MRLKIKKTLLAWCMEGEWGDVRVSKVRMSTTPVQLIRSLWRLVTRTLEESRQRRAKWLLWTSRSADASCTT